MNKPQIIKTETGEKMVVLTERAHDALLARAGDKAAEDRMTVRIVNEASGETALPLEVWDAMADAPSPIGPLREHRGIKQPDLAEDVGCTQAYLSYIESGAKPGSVKILRAIAKALGVKLDDVVPDED